MCRIKVDRQNSGQVVAKIARSNSVNSDIIGHKLTKFLCHVDALLPFNLLKAASRSSNSLSNVRAKSKGRSWQRMRTAPKFNWLP